ncbi:CNBP [Mytilus coruscus]|uniref:CNBP n=1 Tax=Mytilus coruscus TaxID=42192 RepID=A0A6J8D8W8_MYTCO|nr:CNBP [Mytilus coruscus]
MDNQDASMSAQKVEIAFNGVANELHGLREVVNLQGDVATELKGLKSAICSQNVVQGITPFEGNTKDFKAWIKSIEKYALLFNDMERIKEIAFQTCKGACSDYIQRTERVDEPRYKTTRPMTLNRPRRTEPLNSHEPMEIDHYRDAKRCYSCGKVGHVSRNCRSEGNFRQINAVEMQTYHGNSGRNNEIICYQCNQRGHIRPNCPNRKPRTVNMVENWGVYQEN